MAFRYLSIAEYLRLYFHHDLLRSQVGLLRIVWLRENLGQSLLQFSILTFGSSLLNEWFPHSNCLCLKSLTWRADSAETRVHRVFVFIWFNSQSMRFYIWVLLGSFGLSQLLLLKSHGSLPSSCVLYLFHVCRCWCTNTWTDVLHNKLINQSPK